jgi:hypothetical protein
MGGRSIKATVLVEAHFERLVMHYKRTLELKALPSPSFGVNKKLIALIKQYQCIIRSLAFHNQERVFLAFDITNFLQRFLAVFADFTRLINIVSTYTFAARALHSVCPTREIRHIHL